MKGSREKLRKDQASELAAKHLQAIEAEVGCELVILEAETLEEEFGWVFFYNAKAYVEGSQLSAALVGNAPIIVAHDKTIQPTGTAEPLENYLRKFSKRYSSDEETD